MTDMRRGGIFKALLILVVVGTLGAFTWVTIANSQRSGQLNCRPFDADWWTMSSPAGSAAPAGPITPMTLVEDAKHLANQAEERLWGPGGLMERCEGWWQSHLAKRSEGATATNLSADRMHLEQQFADADASFRSGLDAYKRASPSAHGGEEDKLAAAHEAKIHFLRTRDILTASIAPYEALPDHDPGRAHGAHQLLDYDQQLLQLVGIH
jgi:hypothetical protein